MSIWIYVITIRFLGLWMKLWWPSDDSCQTTGLNSYLWLIYFWHGILPLDLCVNYLPHHILSESIHCIIPFM